MTAFKYTGKQPANCDHKCLAEWAVHAMDGGFVKPHEVLSVIEKPYWSDALLAEVIARSPFLISSLAPSDCDDYEKLLLLALEQDDSFSIEIHESCRSYDFLKKVASINPSLIFSKSFVWANERMTEDLCRRLINISPRYLIDCRQDMLSEYAINQVLVNNTHIYFELELNNRLHMLSNMIKSGIAPVENNRLKYKAPKKISCCAKLLMNSVCVHQAAYYKAWLKTYPISDVVKVMAISKARMDVLFALYDAEELRPFLMEQQNNSRFKTGFLESSLGL
jgi:hypothetical protein